ncbi:MAG: PTS sugar transporter subunit IIB [Alphaproteobacteria bacterium]|nr:PTS sugar transporter subunit IIB [Alphaproteobacteria bacterium]
MKKIYLFCTFGMSTSFLANKMQGVATANNLPIEVKAFTVGQIEEIVASEHPDVILLGPQVKHEAATIQAKLADTKIPISLIDAEDYGRVAADKILRKAIDVLQGKKE